MSNQRPLSSDRILSVIIPVRNGAATIGRLIDNLLQQQQPTGWEIEIVIGYQDSSDDTLSILESYDQADALKIVLCDGEGPSANRNVAVQHARGELLYFIDADAVPIGNDFLIRLIAAAESCEDPESPPVIEARGSFLNPEPNALVANPPWRASGVRLRTDVATQPAASAVGSIWTGVSRPFSFGGLGGPILIDPAQGNNPIALADHYACWFDWHAHRGSGESFFQPTVHLLVPRAVFDAVGGFDEHLRVLEDFDFQCRIKDLGLKIYFEQTIPIAHEARGTLLSSWRHSWHWGRPARQQFYQRVESSYRFADRPRLFWLNLPRLFLRRLLVVASTAAAHSKGSTLYCLPFLVATVFAWALGTACGRPQQRRSAVQTSSAGRAAA